MDPLSALSVAASLVQFVDFGSRMLSDAKEMYTSTPGRTLRNLELSTMAADLSKLSKDVQANTRLLETSAEDTSQALLVRLCHECNDVSKELTATLSELRVTSEKKGWQSSPKHRGCFEKCLVSRKD